MSPALVSYDIFCVQQADRIRRQLGLQHHPQVNLHGTVRASHDSVEETFERWGRDTHHNTPSRITPYGF